MRTIRLRGTPTYRLNFLTAQELGEILAPRSHGSCEKLSQARAVMCCVLGVSSAPWRSPFDSAANPSEGEGCRTCSSCSASSPGVAMASPEDFPYEYEEDFLRAVAWWFDRDVGQAVQHGLNREYVEREETLTTLRGRLAVGRQIAARPGQQTTRSSADFRSTAKTRRRTRSSRRLITCSCGRLGSIGRWQHGLDTAHDRHSVMSRRSVSEGLTSLRWPLTG